jgi:glycosyltransferase involved in cell wall biosynthesis
LEGDRARRIAVDLTPVLPGGENGGAKLFAMELIRQMSRIASDCEFILLTSEVSHDELGQLDSTNVRRVCVVSSSGARKYGGSIRKMGFRIYQRISHLIPAPLLARIVRVSQLPVPGRESILKEMDLDVLLCPFTEVAFFDSNVPVVSVVHDLQYAYYPQFFDSEDRYHRDQSFKAACRKAIRMVCDSEHGRETVLNHSDIKPDRVSVIHLQLGRGLERVVVEKQLRILAHYRIKVGRFLFYPSNFWPHKNHAMLITAFGMYRANHPDSDLQLVCTGALAKPLESLREATDRMGLADWIVFPGYVPDEELAALYQSCLAVIFPSLYEGFGIPVLEAMAFGKPVLCSHATSLPEVAGHAALFFDPRKPKEILRAIERIETDPTLAVDLVRRGYERLKYFDDPADMARKYLRVLGEVMATPRLVEDSLHCVYMDGSRT